MADNWRKVCVIEKDPVSSGSNGGMVVDVFWQYKNSSDASGWGQEQLTAYTDTSLYETVVVDDDLDVKVGWVKRDKTGEIVSQ